MHGKRNINCWSVKRGEKRPFGKSRLKWKNMIIMELKKGGWSQINLMNFTEDRN
jgi:hypothetical protein